MFSFEIASSAPRGIPRAENNALAGLTIGVGVFYCVLSLATSIFFFWNGYRILSFFASGPNPTDPQSRRLLRSTSLIIASGSTTPFILFGSLIAVTQWLWQPVGFVLIWWAFFFGCELGSLLQILAFNVPSHPIAPDDGQLTVTEINESKKTTSSSKNELKLGKPSEKGGLKLSGPKWERF